MASDLVQFERNGKVAIITLNRPNNLNALSTHLLQDLSDAFRQAEANPDIRSIILTGSGKAFCAGADLAEVDQIKGSGAMYRWLKMVQGVFNQIEQTTKPTICALNGMAMGGGCELALVCDLRIISATAVMAVPEINVGVLPAGGGMSRLVTLIGLARAKELVMFGRRVTAEQAEALGIVHRAVPSRELMTVCGQWADELADKPPLALRLAKATMHATLHVDAVNAAESEAKAVALLFPTADRIEGTRAFLEKRAPVFTGN